MIYIKEMSAARKLSLISVEDYLGGELNSPIKHEYLGGVVYAMAGARKVHNRIVINAMVALGGRLWDKRCQPFNSDTKIRVTLPGQVRFYYPDASVICRPNPQNDFFQDEPVVIIEVMSHATRRIDDGEKKDAYLTIPSLSVYLLVEQDVPAVVAFRRTAQGIVREVYDGLNAVVPLSEIETHLALAEIYHLVEFTPEPAADDEA